jgi:hypothetical protein
VRLTGLRLIVALALAAWIGRWAAMELAAFVARRLPPGPPPIASPRQPGLMPGPDDLP